MTNKEALDILMEIERAFNVLRNTLEEAALRDPSLIVTHRVVNTAYFECRPHLAQAVGTLHLRG